MSKSILITRPNHDLTTNYLYHWSEVVVKLAEKKLFKVYDLFGKKANRKTFISYLSSRKPDIIFLNGHGDVNRITGYENESLLEVKTHYSTLKNTIIYARSCDAGQILGHTLIEQGSRVFIGYTRKFIFASTSSRTTKPLEDNLAKLFLEPSNLVVTTLIKGHTAEESHTRSKEAMMKNFKKMVSSVATYEERYAALWMWGNMKSQVLYGDKNASVG